MLFLESEHTRPEPQPENASPFQSLNTKKWIQIKNYRKKKGGSLHYSTLLSCIFVDLCLR